MKSQILTLLQVCILVMLWIMGLRYIVHVLQNMKSKSKSKKEHQNEKA